MSQRFYRPELDVLRFGAFILVFASHAFPTDPRVYERGPVPHFVAATVALIAGQGAVGVDLFFVLSAFLITSLLLKERKQYDSIHARFFWIRRALRIWPLYFAMVMFSAAAVPWFLPEYSLTRPYLVPFLFFLGNFACARHGFPHSVAAPLWSVSMEEQFYLVWPLLILLLKTRRSVLAAGLLIVVVGFVSRTIMTVHGAELVAIGTHTLSRIDTFGCGIALAAFFDGSVPEMSPLARIGCLACAALCLACSDLGIWESYGALGLSMSVFGFRDLVAVFLLVGTLGATFAPRILVYFGTISYGLYAIHRFAIAVAVLIPISPGFVGFLITRGAAFSMTVVLAALSYRYFESPFLNLKERFAIVRSRPVDVLAQSPDAQQGGGKVVV